MPMTILKRIRMVGVTGRRRRAAWRAINFQLVVAPSASADIVGPFACVGCCTSFSGVEFVAPHRISPRLRVRSGCKSKGDERRCTHDPCHLCNRMLENGALVTFLAA